MEKNPDIFIKRMVLSNYKELRAISKNEEIPFSMYMKKTLSDIVAGYPDELKQKKTDIDLETLDMVRLRGISVKTYTELSNICENLGVSISSLIKLETKKKAVKLPPGMRLDY
jgi:antitoxin component of RelBE/YafQ-DinJ toxin-antitoxin module